MSNIEFDFNRLSIVKGATVPDLIKWIGELHSELTNAGILPDKVSNQTHNELMVFSSLADGLD